MRKFFSVLLMFVVVGGCSSSPIGDFNRSVSDDRVTAKSMDWKRWQRPDGSLIKVEISLQNDLDPDAKYSFFTSEEEEGAHGVKGILVSQTGSGKFLVEVNPTSNDRPPFQGQVHGNTVVEQSLIPPRRERWGQLQADAIEGSGTAHVLNIRGDKYSRCTCHPFLCRNEAEYQEHAKHIEGLKEEFPTLAAYLANYPGRVFIEAPAASPSGTSTAVASTDSKSVK